MTKRLEIYKCELCGNIVHLLEGGSGELACCNQPMKFMNEQTADYKKEKHVPIIEKTEDGKTRVYVGSTFHPMTNEHYIQWIEIVADGKVYRQNLTPGAEPVAIFDIDVEKVNYDF